MKERKSRAQGASGRSTAVTLRAIRYPVAMRALAVLLLAATATLAEEPVRRLVLVELFTSQG